MTAVVALFIFKIYLERKKPMKRVAKLLIFTAIFSVFLLALFSCDALDLPGVQITINSNQSNDGTSDNNTTDPVKDITDTNENHGNPDGKHDHTPNDDPVVPGDDPSAPGDDPVAPGDDPVVPGDDPIVPGDDPIEPPVTENVDVTFYIHDVTLGEYSVYTVVSVDNGSDLSHIPDVPLFNGAISGSWSLSANEYTVPDFSSISKNMYVYAYYERAVFSITYSYSASKGDYPSGVSNPSTYSAGDILSLVDLTANDGYKFEGWYDTDGNKVSEITANTDGDLYLTAKWSLIEYTITYDCKNGSNSSSNITKYNVETEFDFRSPYMYGKLFCYWVDQSNKRIDSISRGTTGNLHLIACWEADKNVSHHISAIPDPLYAPVETCQKGDKYVFIYYLGYIDKVRLGGESTTYEHTGGTFTQTLSTSQLNSTNWVEGVVTVTSSTVGWQVNLELGIETQLGKEHVASTAVSTTLGLGASGSYFSETTRDDSVTYCSQTTTSVEKSRTWTSEDLCGYYRLTNYGLVDVFAAITYDASEDKYYVYNYNSIREIYQGWDFSSMSTTFNDITVIPDLPFQFPDEVQSFVSSLTEGTENFIIDSGSGMIKSYIGTAADVVIPSYYDGVRITGLADGAFTGNSAITSVKLGQFVSDISANAFRNCTALQSIEWSNCVKSIGESAFYGCISLNTQLPDTLTSIASNAFTDCTSLESVTVSENVTALGENVFSGCINLSLTVYPCSNEMLIASAISGAGYITIDCTRQIGSDGKYASIGSITIQVPDTTDTFTIIGISDASYSDIYLVSNAQNTVVTNISVTNKNGGTGLQIYSANTILTNVSVVMSGNSGNAAQFFHENADLTIHKTVILTGGNSSSAKGGSGLIAVNITLHSRSTYDAAALTVTAGSGSPGGDAVVVESTIEIQQNVDITVAGGNGNSGKGGKGKDYIPAANGYSGGTGLIAANLIVSASEHDIITIFGGNGGNAYNREVGDNAGNGSNGRNGYTGGKGGNAVSLENLIIESGNPEFIGGNGGRGGDASEGNESIWTSAKHGGNGGNGGVGGIAISAYVLTVKDISTLNATGGNGGNGGTRGGMHGEGVVRTGSQGSGGAGGEALSASCLQTIDDSATVNLNNSSAGSAGIGTKWC